MVLLVQAKVISSSPIDDRSELVTPNPNNRGFVCRAYECGCADTTVRPGTIVVIIEP